MKEKFRKFLFPTEDETFLKDTTLNNNIDPQPMMNQQIPTCTVKDFDDDTSFNNEKEVNNSQNMVFNPISFQECEEIAKEIINGNNVIVNLEELLSSEDGDKIATRIVDFLCGASYACNASVKRINDSTFMFAK